jgi:hypothetical protein
VLKLKLALAVLAAFTTSDTAADVLALKLLVAAKLAVRLCVPADRVLVVYVAVAVPALPAVRATLPSEAVPSENETEPAGVWLALADVTVAVIVTVVPAVTGFGLAVSAVVVPVAAAALTTSETAADVLAA